MTWLAPASSHCIALSAVTPPPSCMPPGQAASAPVAAWRLPSSAPSMMMWPPVSPSPRYSSLYQLEGLSDTKLVVGSAAPEPDAGWLFVGAGKGGAQCHDGRGGGMHAPGAAGVQMCSATHAQQGAPLQAKPQPTWHPAAASPSGWIPRSA